MPVSESQAWERAIASNSKDAFPVYTLEINHPSFVEDGQQVPVRLCGDIVDRQFRIENGAAFDAGQDVVFIAAPFEVDRPKMAQDGAFEARIRMSNVGREISKYVDAAIAINAQADVILRGYLSNAPSVVAQGPYRFVMTEVDESDGDVTATIRVADPANAKAFKRVYDMKDFASLLASS